MPVYMLHSNVPLVRTNGQLVAHYIGFAEEHTLWQRLSRHAKVGPGNPKIVAAWHARGAELRLVRIWPEGGRALERHLKQKGHYKSRCPICHQSQKESNYPTLKEMSVLIQGLWQQLMSKRESASSGPLPVGEALYNAGKSHPRVRQVFSTYSGSDPARSKARSGGVASNASAPTNGSAGASAGTKPSLFSTTTGA